MKRTLASLLFLSFAVSTSALAEDRTRARPVVVPTSAKAKQQAPNELDRNVTLTLSGQLQDASPVDLALTGCGRTLQTETIIGTTVIGENEIPNIGSIRFNITQVEGGYRIEYSIGARLPVPTTISNPSQSISIGYHEVMISGTAFFELGKSLQIFRSGDRNLMLTVTEP